MDNIIGRIEVIVAEQKSLLKRYTTEKKIVAEQKSLLKRYTTEKKSCPKGTLNSRRQENLTSWLYIACDVK